MTKWRKDSYPSLPDCIHNGYKTGYYGWKRVGDKQMKLNVWTLIQATGELPNGRQALHSCDNPNCINPKHLRWGTISDNMRDAYARGRHRLTGAKLTEDQVRAIRYEERGKLEDIARKYGISDANVSCIKRGQTWKGI